MKAQPISGSLGPINARELLSQLDLGQIDAQIADLAGDLEALKLLRKALYARSGEPPPEKKPRKKRAASSPPMGSSPAAATPLSGRIREYLLANGAATVPRMAKEMKADTVELTLALRNRPELFRQTADGWTLA